MADTRERFADEVLAGSKLLPAPDEPLVRDVEMRRAVGALFDAAQAMLDDGSVSVVVLAARRLVCLYELLVELGMAPLEGGLVVSDRFLESEPPLRELASHGGILVLDDSVVVGTTLRRLHDWLSRNLPSGCTLRYRAVCRDRQQIADFLFDGMDFDTILERDSNAVQRLSQELVTVLFAHLIPFFSDFPIGRPIKVDRDRWINLLETTGWHVADVTAPGLEIWGRAFALIPADEKFQTYLTRLVPEVAALVDAIKIRLYVRPSDDEFEVVPVALALLAPASPDSLDEALAAIRGASSPGDDLAVPNCEGWRPEAKHRLVQMYAASGALAEIWPTFAQSLPGVGDLDHHRLWLMPVKLYFGPDADDVVSAFDHLVSLYAKTAAGTYPIPANVRGPTATASILDDERVVLLFIETRTLLAKLGAPDAPDRGEITKLGTVIGHAVSSIFGDVDRNEERNQRRDIRRLGSLERYRDWARDNDRVLEQGFTLADLVERLWPETARGDSWSRALISLGIDEGNDLGVVVPITRYDASRDLAYRSYRLGETAQLASSPLVLLTFGTADLEPDRFVTAMRSGQAPVETVKTSVRSAFDVEFGDEDPEDVVRRLLPLGRPIEQYEVRVDEIDVDDGRFLSTVDGIDADLDTVSFPLARLPDASLTTLARGDRFRWTIYEKQDDAWKVRSSEIERVTSPPIDLEALRRNAATLPSVEPGGDGSPG